MESHQTCLKNDTITPNGEGCEPFENRTIGSNPVNGFVLYVERNGGHSKSLCCSSGNFGSSLFSATTSIAGSEVSQDSELLAAPYSEHRKQSGNYFIPHRKMNCCFSSINNEQWCDSIDNSMDSAIQACSISSGTMYLATECNQFGGRSVFDSEGILEQKNAKSGLQDARSQHDVKLDCINSRGSRDRGCKCSKYACISSSIGYKTLTDITAYANLISENILKDAVSQSLSMGWSIQCSGQCNELSCQEDRKRSTLSGGNRNSKATVNCSRISCSSNLCWTPELPYSPNHSRGSHVSSISCSHDSLIVSQVRDDSRFIKEAVSHEVLSLSTKKSRFKLDDPEIYSCPVDTIRPHQRRIFQPKAIIQQPRSGYFRSVLLQNELECKASKKSRKKVVNEEARTSGVKNIKKCLETSPKFSRHCNGKANQKDLPAQFKNSSSHVEHKLCKLNPFCDAKCHSKLDKEEKRLHRRSFSSNIRNAILAFFTFRRTPKELGRCVSAENDFIDASQANFDSLGGIKWGKICPLPSAPPLRHSNKFSAFSNPTQSYNGVTLKLSKNSVPTGGTPRQHSLLFCLRHSRTSSFVEDDELGHSYRRRNSRFSGKQKVSKRALPPLPNKVNISPDKKNRSDEGCDFASIIEKVKDYGWYWGPISGEAAEKVLSNEPDGSFIVRDSSDYHYIFSLTFRLNGVTRHVRIEHDQGNFSFGGLTRFKSQTIVDFIEKAVEHSRSGRYLFFLHRRPVLGPMRVQLLHPVSRFKHVQSLQHLCRFAIVNHVRRDLINSLPLPQRLKEYLSSPHYYSELVERCMSNDAEERERQSPISCLGGSSSVVDGERSLPDFVEAAALPTSAPTNLLPKQFSYQFVHDNSQSNCAGDTLESSTFDFLSPTFITEQQSRSSLSNWPKSSWQRSSDCHASSFYSSHSSYQFSATPTDYSPDNPLRNETKNFQCKKLHKCSSLGDMSNTVRKSAYFCSNLLSALTLETKISLCTDDAGKKLFTN